MKLKNLAVFAFLGMTSGAVHAQSSIDLADYDLVFSDEFEAPHPGTVVDPGKWSSRFYWGPYVTINAEEQLYVDTLGINSNSAHTPFSISDGVLTIEAVRTTDSLKAPAQPNANSDVFANSPDLFHQPNYNPNNVDYLSGLLATTDSYNATHGYFEARLKFPEGQGLWPAFWLLNKTYVENSPEIDIVEFLGHKKNTVHHTMHYINQAENYRTVSTPTFETTGPDYTAEFHTYSVAWDPTRMRFFVDGKLVREVTDEDFLISTQSMYLILNLAVGGSWPGSPDASTEFPAKFEIDYVRAYERKSQPTINQQVLDDEYVLMFSDEFNGSNLNANVWNSAFLWGPYLQINNEEQVYIDKLGLHQNHPVNPFEVSSGTLKIKAAPIAESSLPAVPSASDPVWEEYNSYQQQTNYLEEDGWTPEYSSGILTTYDEFKFVNGYAEARVKMPVGSGLWPAFWLLNGYYVGPSPEMDIMEVRGSEPSKTHHSYHYQNSVGLLQSSAEIYDLPASDVSEFHTYGFQWDSERMVWYVDGVAVRELTGPEVSQQLSYVILNLAVGGNFVNDVGPNVTPAEMEVDWVRVWQIDGAEELPEEEINTAEIANEVAKAVAGLESYGDATGTYEVLGTGYSGSSQGYFHYERGAYTQSIANGLLSENHVSQPLPQDPRLERPGIVTKYDFLVYRCADRVGVFADVGGTISATSEDQTWWSENNCPSYPINFWGNPYFLLSKAIQDSPAAQLVAGEVAKVVAGLESYGDATGTYEVSGTGYSGSSQGYFHYEQGAYTQSIVNGLLSEGHLSQPLPMDARLAQPGIATKYDFLVYRCSDRVAVFADLDGAITATPEDQTWWSDNNCPSFPINFWGNPYFLLSKVIQGSPTGQRVASEVAKAVAGLESYGDATGTYKVSGTGYSGNSQGYFHYEQGAYTQSIVNGLLSEGHVSQPLPQDARLARPGVTTNYDFLVYRCQDRVAVFADVDGAITATSEDQAWWSDNNCPSFPINFWGNPYFLISKAVENSLAAQIVASEVAIAVAGLESYGDATGTYEVSGTGYNGSAQGYFHFEQGVYNQSIANGLLSGGHLSQPLPQDARLARPGISTDYDFLVYRCASRVAVFADVEGAISATNEDQTWWSDNNCPSYPITFWENPYFLISDPLD